MWRPSYFEVHARIPPVAVATPPITSWRIALFPADALRSVSPSRKPRVVYGTDRDGSCPYRFTGTSRTGPSAEQAKKCRAVKMRQRGAVLMALLRVLWRGLLVTAFLSLVSLETFTAQPLISAPLPYHVQFAGTVLIDGHPADPGTYVQIVVFRAGGGYTVCGDTTVQAKMEPTSSGTGKVQVVAYAARLQSSAACLNPANTYSFYVNGIYAGRMGFPGTSMPGYLNLSVTRAALRTNLTQGGVRLVWISGIVTDSHARPARMGLR